jgi:hypothetical protein
MEEVLPREAYETYHNDCFDIVSKATLLLSDPTRMNHMASIAREVMVRNHSHEKRTEQLLEIIENL